MPITLTGSKYSGAVVSLVGTTLTASGVSFAAAQFVVPRLVAFFDSANSFKAVAYVRSYASPTSLVLEYAPFDPVTMLPVAIFNTDVFNVSLNLLELATTGLSVVNTDVTVSDQLIFGVSGDQRSLCLYDEDKDVRQTGGSSWLLQGGVTCFSHLLALASTDYSNPVNMVFQSSATRIVTSSTAAHFFWLGGSLTAQATPAYVGGLPGAEGAGSFVLSRIINSEMDLISANTGKDWGTYPERHVLRDTFVYLSKSNAIGIRWGNGIISGGGAKMRTTLPLAVFGSAGATRIAVGAGPDKRFVVVDVAGNAVFDSGGGIDATNLICSSRASARTTTAVHNYYWRNTYSNMVEGSKLVIRRPADGALVHNDTIGADGTSVPTIFEASVRQNIPLEIYSQWSYGLYRYGYQIVSGSFETSQYDLGADGFSNQVNFGGPMVQSPDTAITESDKSVVLGYSALPSAASFYDYAAAYLEENYAGEMATLVTRSGNTIDAGSHDVVLTSNGAVFGFDGTTITANVGTFAGNITTTGTVTLSGSATVSGTITDANGSRINITREGGGAFSARVAINSAAGDTSFDVTELPITVQPTDTVRIAMGAFGSVARVIDTTGAALLTANVFTLVDDAAIDTSISIGTLTALANSIDSYTTGLGEVGLRVGADLSVYTPEEVIAGLQHWLVTEATLYFGALLATGQANAVAFARGRVTLNHAAFFAQPSEAWGDTLAVPDRGVGVPVVLTSPIGGARPVRPNALGVVLCTAPWAQQEADINEGAISAAVWTAPERTLNGALFT